MVGADIRAAYVLGLQLSKLTAYEHTMTAYENTLAIDFSEVGLREVR